jgi:hypothetical protein
LVECDLAKVDVAGSNPVSRSKSHSLASGVSQALPPTLTTGTQNASQDPFGIILKTLSNAGIGVSSYPITGLLERADPCYNLSQSG